MSLLLLFWPGLGSGPPPPSVVAPTGAVTAETYARQLQQLLPRGAAWSLEPTAWLQKLLLGCGEELARVHARGLTLIDESDPRAVFETLEEWERVLGLPDACVSGEQSIAQRRASVVAKVIAIGGQTPAYYISVAAALGFSVTITEFAPYDVEDDCDSFIYGDAWAYAWQVNATLGDLAEFSVEGQVDEALSWWGNTSLECAIGRLKPGHTYLLFAYN